MSGIEVEPALPLGTNQTHVATADKSSRPSSQENTGVDGSVGSATEPRAPLERHGTAGDLSEMQRARISLFEANKDLQDLCRDNGLTASQFAKKSQNVAVLDTFLGFWPSMKSVMYFPALRELSIVKHPTITKIEGLEDCVNLEQLTISECGLEMIENVENCRKLKKLNLSSNKLQSMAPLHGLEALETLWLNDNRITKIDGLWGARQLTTLWICRNQIERIDSALNGCVSLAELNLADNRICSFKSLLSLANLDQLAVLTLNDPHFGDNPVCRLCNYQTYLMCQLPRLAWLDTIELSARNKQIAEATMLKKKMYYNMRIKSIKRDVQHRIHHANDVRRLAEQHADVNIAALVRHKKELERLLSDLECQGDEAQSIQTVEATRAKLQAIEAYCRDKCASISRMNHDFDSLRSRLQWTADVNISRLMLELETGGNIRLEDGSPSDPWYVSCVDLVKSRLFVADLRPFGVTGFRITRVTRINNRYLRNRFHTRMEEILVVNEAHVKDNVSKKGVTVPMRDDDDGNGSCEPTIEQSAPPGSVPENSLEYLFYTQPPFMEHLRRSEPDQFYAAEYGFRRPADYRSMGLEGGVKLSNSVSLLETSRLLAAFATKGVSMQRRELSEQSILKYSTLTVHEQESELRNEFTREMRDAVKLATQGEWDIPGGVLLVVKVFPGYTKVNTETDAIPTPVDVANHPGFHSLQVVKGVSGSTVSQSVGTNGEVVKQKLYYMFDSTLVLPEYLVEYDYVSASSQAKPGEGSIADVAASPTKKMSDSEEQARVSASLGAAATLAEDFERKYRVRRPPSPQTDDRNFSSGSSAPPALDEAVLRLLETSTNEATSKQETMLPMTRLNLVETRRLKSLNFMGCAMETMPDLSRVKDHLEVLILSYNRLNSLDVSLRTMTKLKHLDVSANRLLKLEHLESLDALSILDASHNQIQAFDDLSCVTQDHIRAKALRHLNLRKNPICSTKRYRIHVLRAIGGSALEVLDEHEVTRDEIVASQRLLTTLTSEMLWERYRSSRPITTTGRSAVATTMTGSSAEARERPCWTAVEELLLNRELISTIDGFEPLVNLRILSLADNAIKQISGLHMCARLEELNLEDNEITTIENLESLSFLKRLNLARNRLVSIDQLDRLESLTQLSLEDNMITSLRGLSSAMKLMELYIGNNRIENLKEVQHLKALPKLTILDLAGNEIARLPDYRLYTVYYLRRVKVLDGVSVSPQDQSDAKQKYSGKLTLEFIMEKCGASSLDRVQELDLSSCRIRELGSIHGKTFPSLRDLNLENNQINDISGLESLPKLRVLNLNRNRIERLLLSANASGGSIPESSAERGILSCTKLEQLFLAYNQINDMAALGLHHLNNLRVLHLQGNAIVFFAGLDASPDLLELRLDKNKIRQLDPHSTLALRRLRVLSLDDNGLRTLSNFNELLSIEFLDLSNNRLTELEEIDKLGVMPTIVELRLVNNPLTKKHMYRHTVLYRLNTLRTLDGREITAEERERVEVLFLHERTAAMMMMNQSDRSGGNSSTNATLFNLTPSTIPSKHSMASSSVTTATGAATMMILTSSGARTVGSQLSNGDMLAGSLLRKNPITPAGFSPNQQPPMQSVNTFPKPDQPTDSSIAIAPGNTTTKGLLNSHRYPGNNQIPFGANGASALPLASMALSSPSPTVTVAAAFNASLSNTGSDQLNLGALRFDRRRMTGVVHYDPALNTNYPQAGPVGMVTGASGLTGSVLTSNAILRAHATNVPSPHTLIHPLSADMSPTPKASAESTRSFSGYVVAVGNQKRFGSLQDRSTAAADLAAAMASVAKSRPR